MMTQSTQTPASPKRHIRTGLALATAALLAACGGGSDSDSESSPPAPVDGPVTPAAPATPALDPRTLQMER